jgi:hypothetical protein
LEFKINKVKQVVEMIEKAHAESEEGTFVPSRDMDELNYALQSKGHPGCTCGYGNKPWKHVLKSTDDSYGKKRKHDELFEDKIQEKMQNILQAEREKMHESFQGHIQEHVQIQLQQLLAKQRNALVLYNPGGHRSSCTSTTAIENNDNHYFIDDLEESKECRLVTSVLGIPRTVAHGLAKPFVEWTLFNSHPIPKGYAIEHVDMVKPGHHRSKLEYPREKVNGNLERTLAITSYSASGTLSLVRKTLNLPVQTHHRHSSNLCRRHHHSSDLCRRHHHNSNLCFCQYHNSGLCHHHHHHSNDMCCHHHNGSQLRRHHHHSQLCHRLRKQLHISRRQHHNRRDLYCCKTRQLNHNLSELRCRKKKTISSPFNRIRPLLSY